MKKFFVLALLATTLFNGSALAADSETEEDNAAKLDCNHKVLVVGMDDNIVSNYFSRDMLVEGTGINEDSVSYVYNKIIENSLAATAKKTKSPFRFVESAGEQETWDTLSKNVRIEGEEDKSTADLSTVDKQQLKKMLDQAGAAYLLVLDAHYLKYQETPFKTLFHYINYSLYDSNKNKLAQGSNYFTSINPQNEAQMMKSSSKSSEKIIDMIAKAVD